VLSCSATRVQTACSATMECEPNKENNPATAAAQTIALVWSNIPDAILVIAHANSNCKSRLEIYEHNFKILEIQAYSI
jgi:hypothetical protein